MTANYEQIREENRRNYGIKTDHLDILSELYAQRTHFLYELLQNAEDAGASRVAVELHADRLEFWHDGKRLFNEQHVRGVCGVCVGTKKGDLGQIGKFGIGFKSVYAYTNCPEIHSGDEHFRIEGYTQPIRIEPRMDLKSPWTTLQVLPFNRSAVRPEKAVKEIDEALRKLGMRTLIFLRNIREMHWVGVGGDAGTIRRDSRAQASGTSRQVQVSQERGGQIDAEEWLIFGRTVAVPPEFAEGSSKKTVEVEIAYRIERGDGNARIVRRAQGTELVVFFPTQKETHLGFLVQGPYRTTPARDNIRENDEWNNLLIEETAALVGDSLGRLKRLNLLTIEVLEAMPIDPEDFPEDGVFGPIYDRVWETLREQPLIPAAKKKFIAGKHAKLCGTSDLRKLLTPSILRQLLGSDEPLNWVEGELSEALRRYLIEELGIEEVTPDTLARRFDESFIARRTDAWVARFYAFLDGRRKLWERGKVWTPPLRSKPFIRLRDRSHVPPFDREDNPLAWLPGPFQADEFPVVRPEVFRGSKRALNFLKNLGLTEPDGVEEVLSHVLPRYERGGRRGQSKQHARDLELINLALKTDSATRRGRLEERLWETPFLWAINPATGKHEFRCPGEIYERTKDLQHYFEGNREVWFLDEKLPDEPDIFLKKASLDKVAIIREEPGVRLDDGDGQYRRGVDGFDPEFKVDGMKVALERITPGKAAYIWNKLLIPHADQIRGEVEFSTSVYFRNAKRETVLSRMGELVTTIAWLPSRSDPEKFHRPDELTLEDLPDEFEQDYSLASDRGHVDKQLGMKLSGVEEFIDKNNIDKECWELFLEGYRKNRPQIEKLLKKLRNRPEPGSSGGVGIKKGIGDRFNEPGTGGELDDQLSSGHIKDPEEYRRRLREYIEGRKGEATISRDSARWGPRKLRKGKDRDTRVFLREQYNGRCQICDETFPKRKGGSYFEAVYLVSIQEVGWVDYPGNVLCLCATCSAKFRYGSVEADDVLGQIQSLCLRGEGGTGDLAIEIRLCGEPARIRFTERHAAHWKELIEIESQEQIGAAGPGTQ